MRFHTETASSSTPTASAIQLRPRQPTAIRVATTPNHAIAARREKPLFIALSVARRHCLSLVFAALWSMASGDQADVCVSFGTGLRLNHGHDTAPANAERHPPPIADVEKIAAIGLVLNKLAQQRTQRHRQRSRSSRWKNRAHASALMRSVSHGGIVRIVHAHDARGRQDQDAMPLTSVECVSDRRRLVPLTALAPPAKNPRPFHPPPLHTLSRRCRQLDRQLQRWADIHGRDNHSIVPPNLSQVFTGTIRRFRAVKHSPADALSCFRVAFRL